MEKETVATEKAATMVMPLPTGERHENRPDGNSRDCGFMASTTTNSAKPARPRTSSSDERSKATSTPAVAISTTATVRQPSAAKGKGGEVPAAACGFLASGVF